MIAALLDVRRIGAAGQRDVGLVGDRAQTVEHDLQGVAVVAGALADLARHVHVWQEVHLDLERAVAGARLASATGDVERESTRLEALDA